MVAPAAVVPFMGKVVTEDNISSVIELTLNGTSPLAEVTIGVGVGPLGVGEIVAEAVRDESEGMGGLRLLLAVQMPKVIRSPRANPMEMARNTSFFIALS